MATTSEKSSLREAAGEHNAEKVERLIYLNDHLSAILPDDVWSMVCEANELAMDILQNALARSKQSY